MCRCLMYIGVGDTKYVPYHFPAVAEVAASLVYNLDNLLVWQRVDAVWR